MLALLLHISVKDYILKHERYFSHINNYIWDLRDKVKHSVKYI